MSQTKCMSTFTVVIYLLCMDKSLHIIENFWRCVISKDYYGLACLSANFEATGCSFQTIHIIVCYMKGTFWVFPAIKSEAYEATGSSLQIIFLNNCYRIRTTWASLAGLPLLRPVVAASKQFYYFQSCSC
jgi:hypothetical protein